MFKVDIWTVCVCVKVSGIKMTSCVIIIDIIKFYILENHHSHGFAGQINSKHVGAGDTRGCVHVLWAELSFVNYLTRIEFFRKICTR